jgi:hypothetical protein
VRTRLALLAAATLATGTIAAAPATTVAAGPGAPITAETDAFELATDDIGDWGEAVDPSPEFAQVGHLLGQDIVSAGVRVADGGETIEFTMEVTFLPGNGGVPEGTRYTLNYLVDGEFVELDGKFLNYSRGACDPTSGQCDPANGKLPRDPGEAPFSIRGNCTTDDTAANITSCQELALVTADFDPRTRTITIPVPASLLEVTQCSVIETGTNLFGGFGSAAPSAFFTSSAMPLDTISNFFTDPFVIPSEDADAPC